MAATATQSTTTAMREKVHFDSGGERCAAWFYPGTNGACVVMAAGLAVAKEPGTDRFAERFNRAGFSVLAFDFRRLGESEGKPRQVVGLGDQQEDFRSAVEYARSLEEVDPARVAIWGFSLSGGHVFPVAAGDPELGAAIAVSALADGIGGLLGRRRLMVPLAGEKGTVAALTTPDSMNGPRALNPGNRYPKWRQEVAAWSALRIGMYRPARDAARVECPLLVIAPEQDGVALPKPLVRAGERAPRGEVARIPGGHYAPYLEEHERAVELQLDFLRRHLLDE